MNTNSSVFVTSLPLHSLSEKQDEASLVHYSLSLLSLFTSSACLFIYRAFFQSIPLSARVTFLTPLHRQPASSLGLPFQNTTFWLSYKDTHRAMTVQKRPIVGVCLNIDILIHSTNNWLCHDIKDIHGSIEERGSKPVLRLCKLNALQYWTVQTNLRV